MSAIAVQLGHLRVARGLTQQQLAERAGLRRDTISALERGKSQGIEFATLAALCNALGVEAGDILAFASTAHVAPILGGDDEDQIITERLADVDEEIATLIADPALAGLALAPEDEDPSFAYPLRGATSKTMAIAESTPGDDETAAKLPLSGRR